MYEAALLHHRQDIGQGVGRAAGGDIPNHHVSSDGRANAFAGTTNLLDDVRLCDDTSHRPMGITDDDKADMCVREQFRYVHKKRIGADRYQPRTGQSFYSIDKYRTYFVTPC